MKTNTHSAINSNVPSVLPATALPTGRPKPSHPTGLCRFGSRLSGTRPQPSSWVAPVGKPAGASHPRGASLRPLPVVAVTVRFGFIILAALVVCASATGLLASPVSAPSGSAPSPAATVAASARLGAGTQVGLALLSPLLAQASPEAAIDRFLQFLAKLFIVIGAILMAYGAYELSRGRITEGLLSVMAGFLLAISIPMMRWLLTLGQ